MEQSSWDEFRDDCVNLCEHDTAAFLDLESGEYEIVGDSDFQPDSASQPSGGITQRNSKPCVSDESGEQVTIAWLGQLADGQPDAVAEFWSQYGGALQRVAERQISSWLRRRVDPEDVVQSACRTFFRRASEGAFSLENHDELWKLLLTITLNKVRMQARFHSRQRRDASKEQALPEVGGLQPMEWDRAIESIELKDMLDHAFADYDDEKRRLLDLWLEGRQQREIAGEIGCSERTVRRMQDRIRTDLQNYMQQDANRVAEK